MFSYEPFSEAQIEKDREEALGLIEPGIYEFETIAADFQLSKSSGNPMIVLQNKVYDSNGQAFMIRDYLLSTKAMRFKIRHYCYSVGLGAEFEAGKFNENLCKGMSGKCRIITRPAREVDGKRYNPQNAIDDYVLGDIPVSVAKPKNDDFHDDNLPF